MDRLQNDPRTRCSNSLGGEESRNLYLRYAFQAQFTPQPFTRDFMRVTGDTLLLLVNDTRDG